MISIGILKREENTKEENEFYKNAVLKYGARPVLIDSSNLQLLEGCSGLILSGGEKKGPLDDLFIKYALKRKMPFLGICQGMQSMAVYNSDLEIVDSKTKIHAQLGVDYVHLVHLEKSKLQDIIQKENIMVNSHHTETVVDSKEFLVVGRSDDGLIEAIEHGEHPFQIGIQWHPERMLEFDQSANLLFEKFIQISNKWKL